MSRQTLTKMKRDLDALAKARSKPRARVDVHCAGEPEPTWPEMRSGDMWLVLELPAKGEE